MKRFLIVVLFAVSCSAFSEVDPRINSYNEFFEQKNYEKALNIAENIIASFPDIIEFRREKAKMLAATNQKEKFMEEMLLIRNSPNPSNIKCFFDALSHDLVSKEFRDDLRRLFFQRKDTEILLSWPQLSTDKEIVVSKVYGNEEYQNEDYSQVSPPPSVIQDPDFQQTGEKAKKNCIANMRLLVGAIEMYNMDHSLLLTSIDSNTIPMFRAQGYLKTNFTPSTQCSYYAHGDLSGLGVVACSVHGQCPSYSELSKNGNSNLSQDSSTTDYSNCSAGELFEKGKELDHECKKIISVYPESHAEFAHIVNELQFSLSVTEKLKDTKDQNIVAKKALLDGIALRQSFIKKWKGKMF